ncbi:MAG: SDR family NAD(P)-dependent oxidoreductase [Gammaproteobacteria bacterium]
MDLQLGGKRALVTGSSSGIGAAIASALAREGAAVVVTGRDAARTQAVAGSIREYGQAAAAVGTLDSDAEAGAIADAALAAFGGIDILVNNAGGYRLGQWDDLAPADFAARINENLLSMVRLIKRLAPPMKARGWGRLIQMGSSGGALAGPGYADYAMSKAGVLSLTLAASREYSPHGVTSNAIGCGVILTPPYEPWLDAVAKERNTDREDAERHLSNTVLHNTVGRFGRVEEVADLVCFLASPRAGYITGATLRVDGGELPVINP